ncbi:hypothetical protein K435DRAFT_800265 [Dendrothele bispora CBS 962.96]|uniref:Uncharacterized protein n=1 Tax=Dendrothele bispora (strain CBS 962.96) TaxID=1314807 RepID=A0A4S8LT59_DENBC|nr:hypothetical protein K435DRAFT_800265 [Dendrothele bispora CBS 962.96]
MYYSIFFTPVITLFFTTLVSPPVHAQNAVTIVPFGDGQAEADLSNFLTGDLGIMSVSPEVVPIGTADGGSETTYQYQEVDIVTGSAGTNTVTATGELIASASGFYISFTAPVPTGSGAGFIVAEQCSFVDASTGGCSVEARMMNGESTVTGLTVQPTGAGRPVAILINSSTSPSGSASDSTASSSDSSSSPGPTQTTSDSNGNDSAAESISVNRFSMIGTVAIGVLLGSMKVL